MLHKRTRGAGRALSKLNSDRFTSCEHWNALGIEAKVQQVQDVNGCVLCGDWTGGHQNRNCPTGYQPCKIAGCGKMHMASLHGSQNAFAGMVHVSSQVRRKPKSSAMTENYRVDPVHRVGARVDGQRTSGGSPVPTQKEVDLENRRVTLYQLERIGLPENLSEATVLTMYDTGANVNIVVTSLAERLGLRGRPIRQTITTAGGDRTVHTTKQYWLPLLKKSGEVHKVLCIGMDRITEDVGMVDVREAAGLFKVDVADVSRPKGQVDLILGIGEAGVFPVHKARKGNLQLLVSCFGSGLLLAGSHPSLKLVGQSRGVAPLHFRMKDSCTVTTTRKYWRRSAKVNLVHSESECLTTRTETSFSESEELS